MPAVVPAGTLLHHGAGQKAPPRGPEWLAFEIEHAENFAKRMERLKRGSPASQDEEIIDQGGGQRPFISRLEHGCFGKSEQGKQHGYLHTYQANRDLNVLILDGISAASQDTGGAGEGAGDLFAMLQLSTDRVAHTGTGDKAIGGTADQASGRDEIDAGARRVCSEITPLGYDAIFRAEAGFEMIYCNFYDDGLALVSATRQMPFNARLNGDDLLRYQWMRAVSRKYDGIGNYRLRIDFSSTVSGLFFPFNYSSPFPGWPERKRLHAAGDKHLKGLKSYALHALRTRDRFTVNWQAVTDLIVDQYSDRLAALSGPKISARTFIREIEGVTLKYFPAASSDQDQSGNTNQMINAVTSCTELYLRLALISRKNWSLSDELLYTAIRTVIYDICSAYFEIYASLLVPTSDLAKKDSCTHAVPLQEPEAERSLIQGRQIIKRLMATLDWADWRKIRRCPADQVFYVAMQPWGSGQDHWNPGCRPIDYFDDMPTGYW